MTRQKRPSADTAEHQTGIDRRHLLQGIAVGVGGAIATGFPVSAQAQPATTAPQARKDYYPPERLGMRGSHPGSFENAHALRDGTLSPADARATGELYDLVVVGGGISGLSAALFFRDARPNARILILDNHDDFGGHAKRNEFHIGGKTLLLNGGTMLISSPRPYSATAAGLLGRLGIDPVKLAATYKPTSAFSALRSAVFFDKATFGRDALVALPTGGGRSGGHTAEALGASLAGSPLSLRAVRDIVRVETGSDDYLAGLSQDEKRLRLSQMSYRDYLASVIKVDPQVLAYYQCRTHGEWGIGIDAEPALDCWGIGFPGFEGLGLDHADVRYMGNTGAGYSSTGGSSSFRFPDGNATIARALVRTLVPAVAPPGPIEQLVGARFDYGQLDRAGQGTRIRLNSTVVHVGRTPAGGVDIAYMAGGALQSVSARACVLACYNMIIPYLLPDLPEAQKAALHQLVKVPLVYTNVLLSNWRAFAKLGINGAQCPGSYFSSFRLTPAADMGGVAQQHTPDDPVMVHMLRTPCDPGAPAERDQHRTGRYELLETPLETFEKHIREQLSTILGPGGFDADRDIAGIAVNRWPHGYAYEYNSLYDPMDIPEAERPHVIGRQRFGPITIANSDSGAAAYTDSAIDQADRAVRELLTAADVKI